MNETYIPFNDAVRTEKPARKAGGGIRNAPSIHRMSDLGSKRFPPINYVVPGFIVEGLTILAGRPKLGKSWLLLDIGLAVARQHFCLGVECEQGDVLYLALEDNERRLQSRVDKISSPACDDKWPARFSYATEWPRADDGGVAAIRQWIEEANNPRLVMVDVLANFRSARGDRDTQYEADYAAIKALQSLASEHRLGIIIAHHTRKSPADSDPFDKVSGTLGLSGAADTTLILDRDGHGATLYGRGRDLEELEVAVEFDRQSCRWHALGNAADVRRTDERAVIVAALADNQEPMSPSEIADALGLPRNNVKQLLFKMAKNGEILRAKRGLYVHPDRANLVIKAVPPYPHNLDNHDNHEASDDE